MSANSRHVEKYSNCRKVFEDFAENYKTEFNAELKENTDMLVLNLQFKNADSVLNFYYNFGGNAVVVSLNDTVKLVTASDMKSTKIHMLDIIVEWHKKNRIL